MRFTDWIQPRPEGLYCLPGDFWIDPSKSVSVALITHAHADHAYSGHQKVYATAETVDLMKIRSFLDESQTAYEKISLREPFEIGPVKVAFYPAGHILGSAQILLEYRNSRVIFSGDYKRRVDGTCERCEIVPCDLFITEATFGLPLYEHPTLSEELEKLIVSLQSFPESGHLLGVYVLGKAQRIMNALLQMGYGEKVYLHRSLQKITDYYHSQNIPLPPYEVVSESTTQDELRGKVIFAPPSSLHDRWSRRVPDPIRCAASGWMRIRSRARLKQVDLPLVISDHVDWPELIHSVHETKAQEVWVTHGQEEGLLQYCKKNQISARALSFIVSEEGEAL